jgi:hypothetical protein
MRKPAAAGWIALLLFVPGVFIAAWCQTPNLAPGFTTLPKGAKVAIMPVDLELFSISAGGVPEPRADWTEAATGHFKAALMQKKEAFGLTAIELSEKDADQFAELNGLHAAIARAIAMHHFGSASLHLPTKDGKLDWSLGESTQVIKQATGADYALFSWVRDGYASAERQAAMVAIAVLTLGRAIPGGGAQTGYASLVELSTGRVLWFNWLRRGSGDLREPDKAVETLDALLRDFPVAK